MPDVQPDPTAPLTASPTGIPSGAGTATPPPTPAPEWRVPETDPRPWARGKTAQELLSVGDAMFNGLQQIATQPQYTPAPAYSPPASPPVDYAALKDDDVVDGRTIKALASQFQAALAPMAGNVSQNARMAYDMVKAQPKRAETFQSYEPEILRELAGLSHNLWTLDNIATVADVIASRHVDEIAERRAQAKLANMQGLPIRGNGLGSASGTAAMESDGLPTNWQEILSKKGLDLPMVRSFCASNDWTVKQWFDNEAKMQPIGSR